MKSASETPDRDAKVVSFLFDADHRSFAESGIYDYGTPCEESFLQALAACDPTREFGARIRRGDVLTHNIASTLKRLIVAPGAIRMREGDSSLSRHAHSERQYGTDRRALKTVIGDVANSLKGGWTSVDFADLPYRLGSTNVYCLSAFPIALPLAIRMDKWLRGYPPYLGAVEVDPGNPVHVRLFARLLDCVYFAAGIMHVSRWETDEGTHKFGRSPTKLFQVVELKFQEFQQAAPAFPGDGLLSERGTLSRDRLRAVTKPSHFERVADELGRSDRRSEIVSAVDLKIVLPSDAQLELPVGKLLGYALNPEHADGKHKARLFSDLLGITATHWRYLAHQLVEGLANARLERTRVTNHGVQYSALVQVVGLNQRTCTVETAWIIRSTGPAQLVTAFPAAKEKQRHESVIPPPFVADSLRGAERWDAIYSAASQHAEGAAAACVPTPMQVHGYEVELEGLCGGASVRLDGRGAFARWLAATGHGTKDYGPGVNVLAQVNSQSAERAEAFAKAFVRVLWLNGIDGAVVETYLS